MITGQRYQFDGFVGTYSCRVYDKRRQPLWEVMTRDEDGLLTTRYVTPMQPEPRPVDAPAVVAPAPPTEVKRASSWREVVLGTAVCAGIIEIVRLLWP